MARLRFGSEDCVLTFPQEGTKRYQLDNSYCISYKKNLWCTSQMQIAVSVQKKDEQKMTTGLTIRTLSHRLQLSTGTRSATNILEREAAIFNVLELQVNPDGSVFGIKNLEEIKARWELEKAFMKKRYDGVQFHKFLKITDRKLQTTSTCLQELKRYRRYGLLCKPLYRGYSGNEQTKLNQPVLCHKGALVIEEYLQLQQLNEKKKQL